MNKIAFSASRLKTFAQCPKKFFHLNIKKDVKPEESDAMREGSRVHKAFENRIKRGVALPPDLQKYERAAAAFDGKGAMAEKRLALNHNFDPVEYFASDVHSRSVADVLVVGDELALVDWKTGTMRDEDEEQLRLTLAMALLTYPMAKAARGLLVYLRDNDRWPVKMSREQAVPVYSEFVAKADRIDYSASKGEWPAKPSGLCRYCPVPGHVCPNKR